ncbi:hypothetical protein K440DRAFT_644062 [Wilcoxina mikolae CBS 423.85]|nr:hypothetical protein K440DRAFT_644062 [Wilcoxina mikolae CBS 423.85]
MCPDLNSNRFVSPTELETSILYGSRVMSPALTNFNNEQLKMSFINRRSLNIRCTEMSSNNLTMNNSKFDWANYNKWSGQVEFLLENKHVFRIVSDDLKKSEALVENASASERLAHATLMESYVDKDGTATSTLLLTMEKRLQLEYTQVKDAKENLFVDVDEADTEEDDSKSAVRKPNRSTDITDSEHIFYLLNGIPNNDDWKIFLEFMQDKDTEDTM